MQDMTRSHLLKAVYWDADVAPAQLNRLLRGDIDRIGHIDRINLYRRLLMTYDWYTLLAPVLDRLYPESLKERYRYARSVLFG
jgi:hypothetical protein